MSILLAIVALGLLIVLHELGHFLVARWCGMKVYEFAVGFGPRLWHVKYGETEYSLRVILLGGYVRVAGMHPAEEDADDPRSFLKSSPGKRFAMIFAGPLANYITAFFVFALLFGFWGIRDDRAQVKVEQKAPAGVFLSGDRIHSVDGKRLRLQPPRSPWVQVRVAFAKRDKQPIELTIMRKGKSYPLTLPRRSKKQKGSLGLRITQWEQITVKRLHTRSLATRLGLQVGDRVLKLDDKLVKNISTLRKALSDRSRRKIVMVVERSGKSKSVVVPKDETAKSDNIGVAWSVEPVLRVSQVKAGGLAQAYGLQKGDILVGLNKKPIQSMTGRTVFQQLQEKLRACEKTKKPLQVVVWRNQKKKSLTVSPDKSGKCGRGLSWSPTGWVLVMDVLAKSAASKFLRKGDKILLVDNQPVVALEGRPFGSVSPLLTLLRARTHRPIEVTYERGGKRYTHLVPMASVNKKGQINYLLGFSPQVDFPRKNVGLGGVFRKSGWETWMWNVRIWDGLSQIVSGQQKANLTGPVGIVRIAEKSVQQGLKYFLFFVAIISIHLAFFNLLPIPALDGGRLMFLFSQQLIRLFGGKEEWAIRAEMVANLIGFLLLFALLIFITFKDIQKLF